MDEAENLVEPLAVVGVAFPLDELSLERLEHLARDGAGDRRRHRLAALAQASGVALHRHFNHNDLYHVIQMAALYAFYRGGALLVDR